MLTLFDQDRRRNRRAFLRSAAPSPWARGHWTLADLASTHARAQESRLPGLLTGKSVIFLFLHGGPSQFETFDPKMAMPEGIRSATGEVATRIPGVTFGGSFPRLAALADRLTVVRSFVPGDANHDIKPIVGRDTFGANLGLVYARVAGANHPATGPAHQRRALPPGRRPDDPAGHDELRPVRRRPARSPRPMPRSTRARAARRRTSCGWPSRATGSTTAAACSPRSTGSRGGSTETAAIEGVDRHARAGLPPAHGRPGRGLRPGAARTRASSPATTPPRWSGPRPSARSGTTTTTTSTTPSRSASCCSWPAGCASAAAASSR